MINTSLQHTQTKYVLDAIYLKTNRDTKYIVLDDVMGNGSNILTIMKKLYDTTNMLNYFFIVLKDIKKYKDYFIAENYKGNQTIKYKYDVLNLIGDSSIFGNLGK